MQFDISKALVIGAPYSVISLKNKILYMWTRAPHRVVVTNVFKVFDVNQPQAD